MSFLNKLQAAGRSNTAGEPIDRSALLFDGYLFNGYLFNGYLFDGYLMDRSSDD